MWGGIPTPHGPCSYCYSPYHHVKDCPTAGQFSNYSYEHRNEPYCDFDHLGWSNQSNISWQAQAPENYAPQFHKLYHQAYPQFNDQALYPLSNSILPTSSPYCADFENNCSLLLRLRHLLSQILTFKLRY
jgi:hypothetical protein